MDSALIWYEPEHRLIACHRLVQIAHVPSGRSLPVHGHYDGSGRPSLIIGNFSNEMMALYHNEGSGLFIDEAPRSALGRATLLTLTFGCFFFDFDLDGWPDVFAANGHVADDVDRVCEALAGFVGDR